MIKADLSGVRIGAISCAVPTQIDNLSKYRIKFGNEAVDKFVAMTGVKERRISRPEQTASDLAYVAAVELLKNEHIETDNIGACIFVTQTPDYRLPATACVVHKRLGLSKDCIAFDVNLGCSGYVYGLNIAASIMKTNGIDKCLLLTGDTSSRYVSDDDKSSCMLFSDSGAATLLSLDKNSEMYGSFRTNGNGFKTIIVPAGACRNNGSGGGIVERSLWGDGNVRSDYEVYMNGTDVFTFSISEVPKLLKEFLVWREKTVADFDCYVFHQANTLILKQLVKKMKMDESKMLNSMERYGNTSVTSIPLVLCDKYGDKTGLLKALLCGFGVGLSWGVVDTQIDSSHIYPIIETDDFYKEGGVLHD